MSTSAQWGASSELDDAALVRAARAGDTDAAAIVIGRWQGFLAAQARRIARGRLDPEDLLASAILGLLDLWRRGAGPDDGIAAYLSRSMRNAVIDLRRSPRSAELSLDELEETSGSAAFAAEESPAWREADLRAEYALVRSAFAALPDDYRVVLRELVVHDRKPAQLTAELDRTAPAISSLALRAKRALRRQLLIEHLGDGGADCQENARELPDSVREDPIEHGANDRGLAHVRSCPRCRRNWARFAAFGSAFGVLPALVLAELAGPSGAAAAADAEHAEAGQARSDGRRPDAASATSATSAMPVAASALARVVASKAFLRTAVAAAAVAVIAFVAAIALGDRDPSAFAIGPHVALPDPALVADFDLEVAASGATGALELALDVPGAATWRVESATVTVPSSVRIIAAPAGWSCPSEPGGGACEITSDAVGRGTLVLQAVVPYPALGGRFSIEIGAIAEGSTRIRGSASGELG